MSKKDVQKSIELALKEINALIRGFKLFFSRGVMRGGWRNYKIQKGHEHWNINGLK